MSNTNERQLLITAYSKKGENVSEFGGLPYPIPIVNPIWVGMDKIIAAQSMGVLNIYVHNVEPPVLLTEELYNKFYELGYIDDEVVKEALDEAKETADKEDEKEAEVAEVKSEETSEEGDTETETEEAEAEESGKPKQKKGKGKGKE
jgi:hypothetical protein|nr:MAG TPA: hypothetical protein [Caudoviricetes sp.]